MRFSAPLLQKSNQNIAISSELVDDETSLLNQLLSRKYDAIITLEKINQPDIESIPFAKEQLMLSIPINDENALMLLGTDI